MMDILHVTPEVVPYSKTGGLADVLNALPRAQARLGHRVSVVTPLYDAVDLARHRVAPAGRSFPVTLGGRTFDFEVASADMGDGVTCRFLRNDDLFGRPRLYGDGDADYADNHLRFAFFSAAVFRMMRALRLRPDVVHCHDWQAGLVPAYNRLHLLDLHATVMTVHNLAYQGQFPAHVLPEVGLPWDVFKPDGIEFYGKVNFLKSGLVWSDRVTTVSPTYAAEVLHAEHGAGLDGVLRARGGDFVGILNGADYAVWDPRHDAHIAAPFGPDDLEGKAACRAALLDEVGLRGAAGPVFGVIGRLAAQKGHDLLAAVMPAIVAQGGVLVVLGSGDPAIEQAVQAAARQHPDRVAVRIAYDDGLAHRIEAGSDFFLMPSRYEPCGLNQIYSLRYGTLPIVHAVGGLQDTVIDLADDPERGNGFKFRAFEPSAFLGALARAFDLHRDPPRHRAAMRRAMAADFGWDVSARAYLDLYESIAAKDAPAG
jgi:starch synthase